MKYKEEEEEKEEGKGRGRGGCRKRVEQNDSSYVINF